MPKRHEKKLAASSRQRSHLEEAASGERNEARIADRINQQNDELDKLMQERESRTKK